MILPSFVKVSKGSAYTCLLKYGISVDFHKTRIIIFIGVGLFGTSGFSQEIKIINQKSGTPVENVALYNPSRTVSTLSDKNGKATFECEASKIDYDATYMVKVRI